MKAVARKPMIWGSDPTPRMYVFYGAAAEYMVNHDTMAQQVVRVADDRIAHADEHVDDVHPMYARLMPPKAEPEVAPAPGESEKVPDKVAAPAPSASSAASAAAPVTPPPAAPKGN